MDFSAIIKALEGGKFPTVEVGLENATLVKMFVVFLILIIIGVIVSKTVSKAL